MTMRFNGLLFTIGEFHHPTECDENYCGEDSSCKLWRNNTA